MCWPISGAYRPSAFLEGLESADGGVSLPGSHRGRKNGDGPSPRLDPRMRQPNPLCDAVNGMILSNQLFPEKLIEIEKACSFRPVFLRSSFLGAHPSWSASICRSTWRSTAFRSLSAPRRAM